MKCPICQSECVQTYQDKMDYILMEETYECHTCNQFHYEFVTGYSSEWLGIFEFCWSWSSRPYWADNLRRATVLRLYRSWWKFFGKEKHDSNH